jgi:hypothetical protein
MRPVLEQAILLPQELVELRQVIPTDPAKQHQLMTAGHHADRIQLQTAQRLDDWQELLGGGHNSGPGKALFGDE